MSDEALGAVTAAQAREDEDAHARIAALTGLGPRAIRRRLREAHGKTLVRTVFAEEWPDHPDRLGELRVKAARDAGLYEEIAHVTGVYAPVVRTRLREAHGATLVGNVFAREWPGGEEEGEEDKEVDDQDDAPRSLGDLTVARARRIGDVVDRIVQATGLWSIRVRWRLNTTRSS
jgi:hypothetical protein